MKIKSLLLLFVCLSGAIAGSAAPNLGNADEEKTLIAILKSTAGPREKDEACARLKRIGTDRSAPALAALLTDENLSHSARYALEPMQSAAAEKALISALGHTAGSLKVGIIDSLGVRADKSAVSPLKKLLNDPDETVACAAATALGHIADSSAFQALLAAMPHSKGQIHLAQVRACLDCAQAQLRIGRDAQAKTAFELIYRDESAPGIRLAAYRGLIYSSGDGARELILKALGGQAGPSQSAALQILHERDFGIVPDLCSMIQDLNPAVLAAAINGLTQNGNAAAVDLARLCTANDDAQVRLAAIRCLGTLGDIAAIPPLEKSAAFGSASEKQAAQDALVRLHHGKITEALVAQLRTADAPIKIEAARALGARADAAAVPALLESAGGGPDSVSSAALQAIALLGRPEDVRELVNVVVRTGSEDTRSAATEALNAVLQRSLATNPKLDLKSLTEAALNSPPEARIALVDACSRLNNAQTRAVLRAAARDADPKIRGAAIRAICESSDVELLPDMVTFATDKNDEKVRAYAVSGCVRLLTQEEGAKLPNNVKVDAFKRILAASPTDADKRVVLSGLARIPDVESLNLAGSLLDDAPVQPEAIQAVIKIASALPVADRSAAKASLDKILAQPIDAETKKSATAALKKLDTQH